MDSVYSTSYSAFSRKLSFFLCGVYACICDLIIIPKFISLACLLPILYKIIVYISKNESFSLKGKHFISWFGLFLLFVCLSCLWSPNSLDFSPRDTENTIFVYKRMLNPFLLTILFFQLKPGYKDITTTLNGLLFGTFLGCFITMIAEKNLVGIARLGNLTYGACPTFGNVAALGAALSFYFTQVKKRKTLYLSLFLFFLLVIFLSGSRQALACILACTITMLFLRKNINFLTIIKSSVLTSLIIVPVICASLEINILYEIIGYRIEEFLAGSDGSNLERGVMRSYAIDLFLQNPIAGVGIHGFAVLFGQYYGWRVWSHCGYTEILSCYGIVGFILFYRYFFFGFKAAFSLMKKKRRLGAFFVSFLINAILFDFFYVIFLDTRTIFLMGAISLSNFLEGTESNAR